MPRRAGREPTEIDFAIHPYYEHSHHPAEIIIDLAAELGRIGIHHERRPPFQRTVFREIMEWLNSPTGKGLDTLYDYRRLDWGALAKRSRSYAVHPVPAYLPKPRISVSAEITSKHNMSVRWHPYHVSINHLEQPADEWRWHPSSDQYFERPDDELLFVRGAGSLYFLHDATIVSRAVTVTLISVVGALYNRRI